jgi:hypothetical protein
VGVELRVRGIERLGVVLGFRNFSIPEGASLIGHDLFFCFAFLESFISCFSSSLLIVY